MLFWGDGKPWISGFSRALTGLVDEGVELLLETNTNTAFLSPKFHTTGSNVRFNITKALFLEELHYRTSALHISFVICLFISQRWWRHEDGDRQESTMAWS